jgi:hypothetical protein
MPDTVQNRIQQYAVLSVTWPVRGDQAVQVLFTDLNDLNVCFNV